MQWGTHGAFQASWFSQCFKTKIQVSIECVKELRFQVLPCDSLKPALTSGSIFHIFSISKLSFLEANVNLCSLLGL